MHLSHPHMNLKKKIVFQFLSIFVAMLTKIEAVEKNEHKNINIIRQFFVEIKFLKLL